MDPTVILVEGESDKAALEAAAGVLGFELSSTSILVMNGATNVVRLLAETVPRGVRVAGLYDVGEEAHIVRALSTVGLMEGRDSTALGRLGFFECDYDLEAELIRALGAARVINVIETQGEDLRRFRSLQQMPEWRGRRVEDQLRRWFGSGSRRKVRYAALLVRAMAAIEVPRPLRQVLEYALGRQTEAPPGPEHPDRVQ
ncbi:MAG: ATP-dependent endonuclease [Acidimicrobiia bacterium]